jgi:hypothetical protein
MDSSFDYDAFKQANQKRLKIYHAFQNFKNDSGQGTRRSVGLGQGSRDDPLGGVSIRTMARPNILSPNVSERFSQSLKYDGNSSTVAITPTLKRKQVDGSSIQYQQDGMSQQGISPSGGGNVASPNTDTEKVHTSSNEQNMDDGDTNDVSAANNNRITNLVVSTQDSSGDDDSNNGGDDDELDDDELDDDGRWGMKKLSSLGTANFERLIRQAVSNFSDDESVSSSHKNGSSNSSSKVASYQQPNVSAGSLKALIEKQRQYNNAVNIQVVGKKYAANISYPDLFLPEEYHRGLFKFMDSRNAYQLCRKEKWTNVVNLMISYLLKMTVRSWAKKEPNFPRQTTLISLRNLFKMWYCNVFSVPVDYHQGTKGRGQRYTEEEILAIEFGMYKYPARKNSGGKNVLDFKWSSILADQELKQILKRRSKQSVMDKATVMCREKVWDSLVFFYHQQQKLWRKVHEMKNNVGTLLDEEDSDMEEN